MSINIENNKDNFQPPMIYKKPVTTLAKKNLDTQNTNILKTNERIESASKNKILIHEAEDIGKKHLAVSSAIEETRARKFDYASNFMMINDENDIVEAEFKIVKTGSGTTDTDLKNYDKPTELKQEIEKAEEKSEAKVEITEVGSIVKDNLEKIGESKKIVKNIVDGDLKKSDEKLKEKHGENFVSKIKAFCRNCWSREKYQIKNLAKIIGGGVAMAGAIYTGPAAPFVYGLGIKLAVEGGVGAFGWLASKERKELIQAERNLYNIQKISESKDKADTKEEICKNNINLKLEESQKNLNDAIEKAGLRQKTINKWGKYISAVAGIAALVTGVPMDIDWKEGAHLVKFDLVSKKLNFVINHTDKLLAIKPDQMASFLAQVGSYIGVFAAPAVTGVISHIRNKKAKAKESITEVAKKPDKNSAIESSPTNNVEPIKSNRTNTADTKNDKKALEDNKLKNKWNPSKDWVINEFVQDFQLSQEDMSEAQKILFGTDKFEKPILEIINIWNAQKQEFRNNKKSNMKNFQEELKRAYEFIGKDSGNIKIKDFLAMDLDKDIKEVKSQKKE